MRSFDKNITRRRFIKHSTNSVFAAGCAAYGFSGCAITQTYKGTARNGMFTGIISEYPELSTAGGAIILEAEGLPEPVAIINIDGTEIRAFSALCAHMGCTVGVSQNFFLCPCHGSTYDLTGSVVRGPAQKGLKRFPVTVDSGSFAIDLSR